MIYISSLLTIEGYIDIMSMQNARSKDMQADEMLTTEEVAKIMKVHVQTVRSWVRKGELAAVWLGKRDYRIRLSTLNEFIAEREGKRGPAQGG
jgi:excisionase family DNA binding protein